MKIAQLIVTAVFAFLGGMTFQFLDGSTSAQDKGGKEDVTHMKELKVDTLQVKELRVYDADWKDCGGTWDHDRIVLFGEDGAAASLTPSSVILTSNANEPSSLFSVVVHKKNGPVVSLRGTDGKNSGKWSDAGIFLFSEDGEGASLGPTNITLLSSKSGPKFSASVDQALGAWLHLSGTNGKVGVSLSANTGKTNSSNVGLYDTDGTTRAAMGFNEKGKPVVATFDGAGKGTGSIGGK